MKFKSRKSTNGWLGAILVGILAVAPADIVNETEPRPGSMEFSAHPFTATAPCSGRESIRVRVRPTRSDDGRSIVSIDFRLSEGTPGDTWGYGVTVTVKSSDGSASILSGDGTFTVPSSGHGPVTSEISTPGRRTTAELIMEKETVSPVDPQSQCSITTAFKF